jgi:phage shock protein A
MDAIHGWARRARWRWELMSSGIDPERDEAEMRRQVIVLRARRMAEQMRMLGAVIAQATMSARDFEAGLRRMAEAMNTASRPASEALTRFIEGL